MVAVLVLLAGIVGGPELARRVYDIVEGGTGPSTQTTAPTPSGGSFEGTVTRVTDGDTFTVGSQRVRLCGIDTPERGERTYVEAGDALRRLVDGRRVECRQVGNGTPCDGRSSATSYDRAVAQCFVGGRDVAAEMVATGLAEDWERYSGGHYAR